MASLVKLDSTNLDQDAYNSTWKYSFLYNIDATQFLNNSFKIDVPTAGTTSTISGILPDGLYSYSDINRSIQIALVNAGAYLINPSCENVFYIQLTDNSVIDCWYVSFSVCNGFKCSAIKYYPTNSSNVHYIVRCDLIKNEYVASGDILSAFDRGDAQVGQIISYRPS
ncbi:unnamed protein product [Phytophthora lilii]|uniref:Unnamed protein product n=1 Tax=Phytophthora lilii TaxID=2077276 RepID=A0A9W6XGQ4_9STRA|nr:unnamed protein product [Phytophthora lilii]